MGVRLSSKQSTASASAVSSTVITTTTSVSAPVISQIYYTDSSYNNTASTLILSTGGYIKIIGTGFEAGSVVYVGGQTSNVIEKTFVSSTEIRIQVGALISATYSLMVFNTNNTGAIYANGVVSSSVPNWTIPAGSIATVYETIAVNNLVTAPSDSAVTYSITGGALPPGVLLNSVTGSLSGTAPTVANQTIYNFTVTAIDAELQTTSREYSYTINPDVVTWNSPAAGATLTAQIGTAYTQALSATSAAGKTISYSANALPAGLSISGSSITGTPSATSSISSLITATAATTNRTATRTFNWNIPLLPTYTITPAASSVNEGSALTFNVGGTNITNGTYYWSINNSTTAAGDFSASTGSFTITSNAGSFTVTAVADVTTEGAQTFTVSLRTGSTSGTIVATSSTVTINDTSRASGQESFTTAGTYTWVAPVGITSVCVVAVGGGGASGGWNGGSGGGLGWKNNIAVTPGSSYTVRVGAGGTKVNGAVAGSAGGDSYFINTTTVKGGGGAGGAQGFDAPAAAGGTYTGDGGGNGGASGIYNLSPSQYGGGGGAGGYAGAGGRGNNATNPPTAGSGGGGGGGNSAPGGGVGLNGQGTNGAAGTTSGGGGSGGTAAGYGAGSSHAGGTLPVTASSGAVRIIWGPGRAFPSTLTTDQ